VPSITANGKTIKRVINFKLLEVLICFGKHNMSKRIFRISNSAHAGIYESNFIQIIGSVLEYACPVWHPGLTKTQMKFNESGNFVWE